MKYARLYSPLAVLALLGACASHPQSDATGATDATSAATADNGWQALRAKYMDCTQRRAAEGISGTASTKAVVSSALDACEGELSAMHDAFRDYLGAQMVSSHGKTGARQAADRVTKDTREKARVYLTGYVDHERYVAKSR